MARDGFDRTTYLVPAIAAEALARLRPGANFAYAVSHGEPSEFHPTVKLIHAARDRGEVTLHRNRPDSASPWNYVARRPRPVEADAAQGKPISQQAVFPALDSPEGRVLLAIETAALAGLPCPTNAELADAALLRDADAASYRLRKLQEQGLIRIRYHDAGRVVAIIGTQLETAR